MLKLKRYWIRFEDLGCPPMLSLGCGVTAWTRDDALNLVSAHVFGGGALPEVTSVIENVDVRTLDAGHIRPNMGDVSTRGVWFPDFDK